MVASSGHRPDELKVCAVVVTHNRRETLRECLRALLAQTRPVDEIMVVDNASTDGTERMLSAEFPQVTHVRLPVNTGGAGGFHEGVKLAWQRGYDWIWTMDDDTVAYPDALSALLDPLDDIEEEVGLLCSHVVWTDGAAHIMNVPRVSALIPPSTSERRACPFNQHLEKGVVRLRGCSFVSALFSRRAIEAVGLPLREMFIYGDDVEFTQRVSRSLPCFYVIASKVLHKTPENSGADISTAPADKLWRYSYRVRNDIYLSRRQGPASLLWYCLAVWPCELKAALKRKESRLEAARRCLQGMLGGLLFRPRVESVARAVEDQRP